MPCRDYIAINSKPSQKELDADLTEAVLCAFTRTLKNNSTKEYPEFNHFLNYINWEESGVTKKEYLDWWDRHELIDDQRIKKNKNQIEMARKRNDALSKLTGEERILLGLDES